MFGVMLHLIKMTRPSMKHFSFDPYLMNVFSLAYSDLMALPAGDSEDNLGTKAVARQASVWSLQYRAGFTFHQNLVYYVKAKV